MGPNQKYFNHTVINLLPLKSRLQASSGIQFAFSFERYKSQSARGGVKLHSWSNSWSPEYQCLKYCYFLSVSYSQYNCIPCYVTATSIFQITIPPLLLDTRTHILPELCPTTRSLNPDALEHTYLQYARRKNPVILLHQEKGRSSWTWGSEYKNRYSS